MITTTIAILTITLAAHLQGLAGGVGNQQQGGPPDRVKIGTKSVERADYYRARAMSLIREGKLAEAEAYARDSVDLRDDLIARRTLLETLMRQRKFQEALDLYEDSTFRSVPDRARLGLILLETGRVDESRAYWQSRYAEPHRTDPAGYREAIPVAKDVDSLRAAWVWAIAIAEAQNMGSYKEYYLELAHELLPENPRISLELSRIYTSKRLYAEAIRLIESAKEHSTLDLRRSAEKALQDVRRRAQTRPWPPPGGGGLESGNSAARG